jgi:translation initiation factor 3 subunit G|tara:strand:+ start:3129 stop:3866 length:738 start_codon:yes stop_codon:yes gene_type:complete
MSKINKHCLPPPTSSGPDKNGIKTYIEYRFNDKNQFPPHVKVTRRVKVKTTTKKVKRAVQERKHWAKFGAAEGKKTGEIDTNVTIYSNEEVFIESPFAKQEDTAVTLFKKLEAEKIKRMIRKDMKSDIDSFMGVKKNSYVVPGMRKDSKGTFGQKMSGRDNSTTLRVTNLSEETQERDIRDLFSPYGNITRVHLALDHHTQRSRGFAFVSFCLKEDAQDAMDNVKGTAINHLILGIDWAKPSKAK